MASLWGRREQSALGPACSRQRQPWPWPRESEITCIPTSNMDLATLEANLERASALEQQMSIARASVHEALGNLLQSRSDVSTSGAMLSAATRAAMGKRGISQLESVRGLLDMASDTASLVRADAAALRTEVERVVAARDAAVTAVAAAESKSEETCQRVEAAGAAAAIASNELAARAEREAATSTARAEAAELRAEQAERGFVEAERSRMQAARSLSEADAAREAASARLSTVETQLVREREVLAKVMSENVLFVKRIEFAEAERARALEEKEALRSKWREQTEGWFATAAAELQQRLLGDWGAADGLQSELAASRQERARADAAHLERLEAVSIAEAALRAEAQTLAAEREALQSERGALQAKLDTTCGQLKEAQLAGQQLLAQAEVRAQQIDELKAVEREYRERGEVEGAAMRDLRASEDAAQREAARSRAALEASEEKSRLALKVSERVRAEASDEHVRMLEMQAKYETLQEAHDALLRQNRVFVGMAEGLAAHSDP
jgi:hypothetical protein